MGTKSTPAWWNETGDKIAEAVAESALDIARISDTQRRRDLIAWRSLYLDLPYKEYASARVRRGDMRSRYNLTQGAVDATRSRIVSTRPRPQVLTVAGRWKLQRKAKLLQRWIDGEYERLKCYDLLSRQVQDALIYGTGCLKVIADTSYNRCRIDRVWVGDLLVDPREERYDCVRSLYHVTCADRGVLMARWAKHAKKIEKLASNIADDALFPDMAQDKVAHDLVPIVEAWRLPSGPKQPGKHAIILGRKLCVFEEDWEHDSFPFSFYNWGEDPNRFFGQGMVERGAGIQSDLNEHTRVVQEAYDTFVPKWGIPRAANVKVEALNDEIRQVVMFDAAGGTPTVLAPPAVSPDFLRREDMLAERYYRVCGVSELSAASQKPAGIDSGAGIRSYQDAETQRFLTQGRAYERASIDLANLLIYTAKQIAKTSKQHSLDVYGGKNGLEIARFDEAVFDGEDEIYQIRTFPVSALSNSVSAKLEEVQQLIQVAAITDPNVIRELLALPDLEQHQDLESARREAADREIDLCLDGEQGLPSTYMDLDYAINRADQEVCHAEIGGAEEDVLQLLRSFCGQARTLQQQLAANAPPAGPTMGPMGPPTGPVAGPPIMPPPDGMTTPEMPVVPARMTA